MIQSESDRGGNYCWVPHVAGYLFSYALQTRFSQCFSGKPQKWSGQSVLSFTHFQNFQKLLFFLFFISHQLASSRHKTVIFLPLITRSPFPYSNLLLLYFISFFSFFERKTSELILFRLEQIWWVVFKSPPFMFTF